MTTLRIRLAAPSSPEASAEWALYDDKGVCVQKGDDRPAAWPNADRVDVVLSASRLRIASIQLPPLPSSRIAGAARFALEDQLAGKPEAHLLSVSTQGPNGRVRVAIVGRALVGDIARSLRSVTRIVAESDLARSETEWLWCAAEGSDQGFVQCPDGSAFPVDAPVRDRALPAELALALTQNSRTGPTPSRVRVDAACDDATLRRFEVETKTSFVRGAPWQWHAATATAFRDAIDLMPSAGVAEARASPARIGRVFAPAIALAAAALVLHVLATVGEWAALRIDRWREASDWTTLAVSAGIPADAAASPESARDALVRRYGDLRHAHGLPAPDDALPLLAKAAPALAALPPGMLKSLVYGDRHWTVETSRTDPNAINDLDARLRAAGVPALIATSANGARLRFGGP